MEDFTFMDLDNKIKKFEQSCERLAQIDAEKLNEKINTEILENELKIAEEILTSVPQLTSYPTTSKIHPLIAHICFGFVFLNPVNLLKVLLVIMVVFFESILVSVYIKLSCLDSWFYFMNFCWTSFVSW